LNFNFFVHQQNLLFTLLRLATSPAAWQ